MANPYIKQGIMPGEFEGIPEMPQILRRQKMAEQLLQEGKEPLQGQMVSGHYVAPSWTQYLAKGLKQYQGTKQLSEAEKAQQDAIEGYRKRNQEEISKMAEILSGRPAITLPQGQQGPTAPAKQPDLNEAYRFAASSSNPALQQFGMNAALTNAQKQAELLQQNALRQQNAKLWQDVGGDAQKFIMMGGDPAIAKQFAESQYLGKEEGVKVGDSLLGKYTGKTIGTAPNPNKPFNADGTPNKAYQDWEMAKATAGRPQVNVSTKVENKAAENIAGQVGGMLEKSAVAAEGAAKTIDAANRVIQAVDSKKIIAGPLAGGRLTIAQASQMLGIGGRNEAEVIANTRQAIRGLAEMTLQGRKQMSGQGAITESESKLAEKAMSGNIEDLTPSEIRQLAAASKRSGEWTLKTHQGKLNAARRLPGGAELVPFFETSSAPELGGNGAKFLGFE